MAHNVYGIDLGTCNFKILSKASGKLCMEKNAVAIINNSKIYAYGDRAYAMYEKAPEEISVQFPIERGVITDFYYLQAMIYDYITNHMKGKIKGAEFVVAVPTAITDVEKRAFYDTFYKSKVKLKNVLLCEKPIADAVGIGLDVNEPTGVMIVDFGADTTEISVISLGGLVLSELLPFGGNRLDEAIVSYIRKEFHLVIGRKTACVLKETLGSALPGRTETMSVVGRDIVSGLPVEMEIYAGVVYQAIQPHLESFCNSVKMILEKTPPELAKDIIHTGFYITGGGSQLRGLGPMLESQTRIHVNSCEYPEDTSVRGLVKIVSDSNFKRLVYQIKNRLF